MAAGSSKVSVSLTRGAWGFFSLAVLGLAVMAWSNDSITPEDVWTLYTARCKDGNWQARRCTGRLRAAERHRFTTDKAKGEVGFEVIGDAGASSGRLSGCAIEDGRNWTCAGPSTGPRPLVRQLAHSEPVAAQEGPGQARLISKRTWYLLRLGVPVHAEASR